MSKLSKLKHWLLVPDAARYLTLSFGEEVTEADVLRLALDQRLKLSVRFVNQTHARSGEIVQIDEASFREVQYRDGDDPIRIYGGPIILDSDGQPSHVINLATELCVLEGIFDLPMVGGERLEIERAFQKLISGPDVTDITLDGVFVEGANGKVFQLQVVAEHTEVLKQPAQEKPQLTPAKYLPTDSIPSDAVLVVRTTELLCFEDRCSEKPAAVVREQSCLAVVVGLLGRWPRGAIPSSKDLESTALALGVQISDDTIRKVLRSAREIAPKLPAY